MSGQIIIHVDMDAFFASVEIRDNPSLRGKPVIIGSLPGERGVVSTCSYEARRYGVRSAMNIKEAYRRCPNGIYLHPNFRKYQETSEQIHGIWDEYADVSETVALDEAYLDVTASAKTFEKAAETARNIQKRISEEVGLGCSVGVGYSKTSAKTASEEKKPGGFYEIATPEAFVDLIIDRDVRTLYTVGRKTAEKLRGAGIGTVRELRENEDRVIALLGNHGRALIDLAHGIDDAKVTPRLPESARSVSREITFQHDVADYGFLKDVLLLLAFSVEERAKRYGLHGNGIVLKITYGNMESITRTRSAASCDDAAVIYRKTSEMLDAVEKHPVRLIGAGICNIDNGKFRQLTLDDIFEIATGERRAAIKEGLDRLKERYGIDFAGCMPAVYGERLRNIVERMRTQTRTVS